MFHGCEFSIALNGDHGDQSVTHALVGDLEGALPLWPTSVVTKFNDIACSVPVVLHGEIEIAHPFTVKTNSVLPFAEVRNPFVPGVR